jgi:hypothetical protein
MVGGAMKKSKYVMSQSELASLTDEKKMSESAIREFETEGYGQGTRATQFDPNKVRAEIKRYDTIIKDHTPSPLRGGDKDRMAKRADELKRSISEGMPTYSEMNDIRKNPDAPRKNLMWEKRNAGAIHEYKQIMRRLEPHDGGAASIERFRGGR